mgnify:CR=1 FL=1
MRWEKVDNPKYECLDSYTVEEYEEIGEAIVISLTELHGFNPLTRLLSSPYVNMRVCLSTRLFVVTKRQLEFEIEDSTESAERSTVQT